MVQWRLVSHLPSTVAALAAQVLAVGQQPGGAGTLEGEPWVNEGRGATVVIHKEGLRIEMQYPPSCMVNSTTCTQTHLLMQCTESKDYKEAAQLSTYFNH